MKLGELSTGLSFQAGPRILSKQEDLDEHSRCLVLYEQRADGKWEEPSQDIYLLMRNDREITRVTIDTNHTVIPLD